MATGVTSERPGPEGQTGRYRGRPGFASAGEALGGLRYINGYPGQAPPRPGISLGDLREEVEDLDLLPSEGIV